MNDTVLAFDLAYRSTGWAHVRWEGRNRWTVLAFGISKVRPIGASPVTEHVRIRWAGSGMEDMNRVIASCEPIDAIVYESPAAWQLAKARAQTYRPMRTKTNKDAIMGFGAARERMYQAVHAAIGEAAQQIPIVSVDPRRWQHVVDRVMLGDVTRMDKKQQIRAAVAHLTGIDLKGVLQDTVDAIGLGLWASEALAKGRLIKLEK